MTLVVGLATTGVSAQGFLKKLQKAADKVESVTKTVETVTGTANGEEQANDSISPSDFLATAPLYQVKKVVETDEVGTVIANEDGTPIYKYLLIDKDGKVCDRKTAKKHLNSALKSGSSILLKVGGGAAGGALIGKKAGGGKKGAWIGAGVGAAAGLLASSGEIDESVQKGFKGVRKYFYRRGYANRCFYRPNQCKWHQFRRMRRDHEKRG